MPASDDDRIRPVILFPAVALLLMTLACNLAQRSQVRTDPATGEEYLDEYTLSDEDLIDRYLDITLDELADADGCNRDAARRSLEGAHPYCRERASEEWEKGLVDGSWIAYRECMDDRKALYRQDVERACAAPTVSPLEDTEPPPDTEGSLTLLGFESELVQCDSSPEGDYYTLDCSFSVTVDLAYEIPATPAYAFCKVSTRTGGGQSSVELSDLQGETKLTMELGGIMRLFENGESPVAGVDGYYANLSCFLGEFEGGETSAWDSFKCRHPDVEDKDCEGPWLDMSGG